MIYKIFKILLQKLFNTRRKQDLLLNFFFEIFNRNSLIYAYNSIGILNYKNKKISGEDFLLQNFLVNNISDEEGTIIFDVGANKGDYSEALSKLFSNSLIYSFEPGPEAYNIMKNRLKGFKNIVPFNFGFDNKIGEKELYSYQNEGASEHATIYKSVFKDIHKNIDISSHPVALFRLDSFCEKEGISKIDFLKVDTEGSELRVLQGCGDMLQEGRIKIIQFEFNEMNIISKTFLKDFYDLLDNYSFYRLIETGLLPLKEYQSFYEIFKFQNILAIRNKNN